MCIANICTERSFINNFYDLVQMSLGQKGPWVDDFPAARFIPNQHNQDHLLSFWSNDRLTLKLCIFRLALILALFSFLLAMSEESKCGQIEYQKHLSCLLIWPNQFTDLILKVLLAGTIFNKASCWQPLPEGVGIKSPFFSWWYLVREKRKQIQLLTFEEFLA